MAWNRVELICFKCSYKNAVLGFFLKLLKSKSTVSPILYGHSFSSKSSRRNRYGRGNQII